MSPWSDARHARDLSVFWRSTVYVVGFFVITYFIVKVWEDLHKKKKK